MRLADLCTELAAIAQLGPIEYRPAASPVTVTDVVHDSRHAIEGSLFCAVPGLTVDGHDYIPSAIASGASAALVERFVTTECPQIKVASVRETMAHAAAVVHDHPSNDVAVVGITGTNGKTTTTQLLAGIVRSTGQQCSVIGTLDGVHTTPESPDLQRQLRAHVAGGTDVVAIEVSSHALDQRRVDATQFAVAAFSNLTPDHLDYHGDMDEYFRAKSQLFDGRAQAELINIDDSWGQALAATRPDAGTVSLRDVTIENETISGTQFTWRDQLTSIPLPGRMNVANALMAAEAALLLDIDPAAIAAGLSQAQPVAGRMETVVTRGSGQPTVIVDYSHTPDSIERALSTVRTVAPESGISIVFGCGGDRDRLKRPLMGQAAERGADRVYLTSDNPRSEDPAVIIAHALEGFDDPSSAIVDPDRKAAISRAIIDAGPGDIVLIAGKGHEKTQTIGANVLPFDDVQIAHDILEALNS